MPKQFLAEEGFSQLEGILKEKRNLNDGFMLFVVDHYFKGKELESRLPIEAGDVVRFIDVDPEEPTPQQIDT